MDFAEGVRNFFIDAFRHECFARNLAEPRGTFFIWNRAEAFAALRPLNLPERPAKKQQLKKVPYPKNS